MVDYDNVGRWLAEHDIRMVRVIGASHEGRLQGKFVRTDLFVDSLPDGIPITDSVFILGPDGEPALGWDFSSMVGDLGDVIMRPDLDTLVVDPRLDGLASVLCDYYRSDGTPVPVCPRSALKKVLGRIADLGFEVKASFELEVVGYYDSMEETVAKGFRGMRRLGNSSPVEYRSHRPKELFHMMDAIRERFEALDLGWETMIDEWGDGLFEVTISPGEGVEGADKATRGRLAILEVADELDRSVTFMPVPEEHVTVTGCHLNLSLWKDGEPAFFDPSKDGNHSDTLRHFLGGVMETMAAAVTFMYPTVNSFRRVADLSSAPSYALWGEDNKTVAVRTITRSPNSARIEYRLPAGDTNPYLVLATVLAGGVAGLEQGIEPPPPYDGMGWALPEGQPRLPESIEDALVALEEDTLLTSILGEGLVGHWVGSRRWESLLFQESTSEEEREEVTDFELQRYFDGI